MRLNADQVKSIKEKKVTYVPNFVPKDKRYDFNFFTELIEMYDIGINCKVNEAITPKEFLRGTYQIQEMQYKDTNAHVYLDFLRNLFKYPVHEYDGVDLFFSFASCTGRAHDDPEDVFIISLYGKTIYRVFQHPTIDTDSDYILNPGDLIHIPKGKPHKALSVGGRLIYSVGFFGEKK